MNLKKTFKILIFMFIFVLVILGTNCNVEAANVSISANKTNVTVGSEIIITVSGNAGSWNLNMNGGGLTYISGQTNIVGFTNKTDNSSFSSSITYKADKVGTYVVSLSGDITDYYTDKFEDINSKSVTIKVTSAGDNNSSGNNSNTITSLKVGDKTYSNPNTDITIGNVESSVENIVIKPTTSNGASYTINGGSSTTVPLRTGTNVITIAVSGGKTYKVRITRLAGEAEVPPNIIDENQEQKTDDEQKQENKLILSSLKVKNFNLEPEFNSEVYSYTININMKEHDINKLDIDAIPSASDATVEILGNENLVEGENIITILIKSANGEESVVYQIIVNKIDETTEVVSASPLDNIGFLSNFNPLQKMLIIGFATLILIIVIIIVIVAIRKRKKKKQAEIPYSNIYEDESYMDKQNTEMQEDMAVEEKQEVNEEQKQDEKDKPLEEDKSKLMDEFFSYNQENEPDDNKKQKGKGKGKHF